MDGVLQKIKEDDEALKKLAFEKELEKDHVKRAELLAERAMQEEKKRMDTSEGVK